MNYQSASLYIHADVETQLDSTVMQALDCVRRESESQLDLLVLFEAIKYQVLQLADIRAETLTLRGSRTSLYEQDLSVLHKQLLDSQDISGEYRSALLLLLAMAYYGLRDLPCAQELALLARRQTTDIGQNDTLGFIDMLLAICCIELKQWESAADRCILALNEISPHENKSVLAQLWQIYARALGKLAHNEEAVAALVMSQNLYGQQKSYKKQIQAMLQLAALFKDNADWHGMVYYLKQALVLCCHNTYAHMEIQVLNMLKFAYRNLGRSTESDGCSQRILHLQRNF